MQPFRTMLFAADFSENSRESFRLACSLAVENKTRLIVLHVAEPARAANGPASLEAPAVPPLKAGTDQVRHDALKQKLREDYIPHHPIDVEYRVNEGDVAAEVVRAADTIGADLIVMGTHGRTGPRRLLAGSVAAAVLRGAHCAVVALRSHDVPRAAKEVRVVLHPMDASDGSETARGVARSLARDLGAKLVLLHVVPVAFFPSELAMPVDPRAYRDVLEVVREHLDGPDLKCPVEARLSQGDAAAEILRTARDVEADLIVMGTQGRTGLGRLLLGSVAESVLAKADCPTMVVKARRRRRATPMPSAQEQEPAVSRL